MQQAIFILCLLIASNIAFSQDTLSVDLNEAVDYAIENNENLAQSYFNQDIANEQYQVAIANYLPNISLTGEYTRNIKLPVFFLPEDSPFGGGPGGGTNGPQVLEVGNKNSFSAGIQGNIPLFNKAILENIKGARIRTNLAERNLEAEVNELKAQVRSAFFNALIAQNMVGVQQLRLNISEENLRITREQYEEGLVAEYDFLRTRINVENIRPNVIEALNNYNAVLNNLKVLMGMSVDTPLELKGELDGYAEIVSPEFLREFSVQTNPNLLALSVQQDVQQVQIDAQQANYYPGLSAFGNYNYLAQDNDFNISQYRWVETSAAGVSLNWNIFQGFITRNRVQIEKINLDILDKQYSFLERSLKAEADNALKTIRRTLVNIEVQEDNVELAERAFGIAQLSYRNGVSSLLELNDAELALADARVNYLSSIQQYLSALSDYQRIVGEDIIEFTAE